MPKELFGQDLVNELALGQRIAAGEKSVQGGLNITVEKLFEQIKAYLSDSEVITPDNTTVWDEYEVYPAGNVFVSYTNTSSPNPIFHDAAIYRSRVETPYGVSPEDDLYDIITNPTGKWEYQGQKVVVQEGGLSKVFFLNESEIQSVTGYIEGNNAVNLSDFKVYEYSSSANSGIKPNDNGDATGRWVEVGELGGGGGGIYDPSLRIINIEEGSNIILDANSDNTYYRYKGASPITVTVPNTIPLALPLAINQMGVGEITLQGAAGVVLTTANLKTGGQGFGVTIMKVANNLVDVIGGVE